MRGKLQTNLKVKKLLSKPIPKSCIRKTYQIKVGDSTVKYLIEKFIANKTTKDKIIIVKPFSGGRTKTIKHNLSPDLEKNSDLVIIHTGTKDLKSVSRPKDIAN